MVHYVVRVYVSWHVYLILILSMIIMSGVYSINYDSLIFIGQEVIIMINIV